MPPNNYTTVSLPYITLDVCTFIIYNNKKKTYNSIWENNSQDFTNMNYSWCHLSLKKKFIDTDRKIYLYI